MEESRREYLNDPEIGDSEVIRTPVTGPGLKTRMMAWILLLSILPVLIVGLACDIILQSELRKNVERNLTAALSLKMMDVEQYFKTIRRDIRIQAKRPSSVMLLESLSDGLAQSGMTPSDYVNSVDWRARISRWKDRTGRTGDMDSRAVMIIDLNGDILFSSATEHIVGNNVFGSNYTGTPLPNDCRSAMKTDEPVFSDYERYMEDGFENVRAHMIMGLYDSQNKAVGLLAFQLNVSGLNRIMAGYPEWGHTFEMYLVGNDHRLRTDSGKRRERKAMTYMPDTMITRFPAQSPGKDPVVMTYTGPDNVVMVGVNNRIRVGAVQYHMIGEIEEREAYALLAKTRQIYALFAGGGVVFVIVVSLLLSGNLVRPVLVLTDWARNVAIGDLSLWEMEGRSDELGQFIHSFRQVVVFLKETALLALSVSSGDYSADIEPRSANDELGAALEQVTRSLREAADAMAALAGGNFDVEVRVKGPNDLFAKSVNSMVKKIKHTHEVNEQQARMKSLQAELSEIMRGDQAPHELARRVLSFFCLSFGASVGAFYIADDDGQCLQLHGSFACDAGHHPAAVILPGQGLVGQVMIEKKKILLDHCPGDYMMIHGLTVHYVPSSVVAFPFARGERLEAVLEMGFMMAVTDNELGFLDLVSESVSIALSSAISRVKLKQLLDKTVMQAEDLKTNQEKLDGINRDLQAKTRDLQQTEAQLRAVNLDLTHQAERLRDSEKQLKQKEEELISANMALEERSMNLEEQRNAIKEKNIQLEITQKELLEKSERLENSSRYKSEFLANMSHELRTPLNSILLISRLLAENKWGNLSDKQVEFSRTIMTAGRDLLALIDEILDLSKIESGKLEMHVAHASIQEFRGKILAGFEPVCREKGIGFGVDVDENVPDSVYYDASRVDQVLKNLVANAVKFTAHGEVRVRIRIPDRLPLKLNAGARPQDTLLLEVSDTGIGIAENKLNLIFEAFKQADGAISREYGGTGLGLSISRQLIRLMGGDVVVESVSGKGSVFRVYLPGVFESSVRGDILTSVGTEPQPVLMPVAGTGDRIDPAADVDSSDHPVEFAGKTMLIVDDDMRNVYALMHSLGDYGLDILVAKSGRECMDVFEKHSDIDLVIMDVMMSDMGGYEAMKYLRAHPRFKAIPVVAITAKAMKGDRERCLQAGASEYLSKPVDMDRLISVMKEMLT